MLSIFASEAPNGYHLAGDKNEVYWGSLAFFVLLALIIWKAGPAIKRLVTGRTDRIRAELDTAAKARAEAEAALTASSADLPDVSTEEARIRNEAEETASRLKTDLAAKARSDAEALLGRAALDVETQKGQALADLREEFARLTRGAAEAVITDRLDAGAHADLIDGYIGRVAQS